MEKNKSDITAKTLVSLTSAIIGAASLLAWQKRHNLKETIIETKDKATELALKSKEKINYMGQETKKVISLFSRSDSFDDTTNSNQENKNTEINQINDKTKSVGFVGEAFQKNENNSSTEITETKKEIQG